MLSVVAGSVLHVLASLSGLRAADDLHSRLTKALGSDIAVIDVLRPCKRPAMEQSS